MFDYLIVGAGLYGAVFAHEATKVGKRCLVLEKRHHLGGNIFTKKMEGIDVHMYGPHIFHTSNRKLWNYVNRFAEFNSFVNRPKVRYKDHLYSFPINMMTLHQLWGVTTVAEAKARLESAKVDIGHPQNLEEWCLANIGLELYNTFIRGYTQKQWQTDPKNLPTSIIKRIPVRLNFDDNYFFDQFQGIPVGGYTQIVEGLLKDTPISLGVEYLDDKEYFNTIARKVIYTGPIDAYFNYCYGDLEYRTSKFEHKVFPTEDHQGNAIINYTDRAVPYTRTVEHKHFDWKGGNDQTVVTFETPEAWSRDKDPYYPVNNERNNNLYSNYRALTVTSPNISFGGRLGTYQYYDMHQVIASALFDVNKELNKSAVA